MLSLATKIESIISYYEGELVTINGLMKTSRIRFDRTLAKNL